jgi:hypothetical protein
MTLIPDLERQLTDAASGRASRLGRRLARGLAGGAVAAVLLAGLLMVTLGDSGEPKHRAGPPAGPLGLDIPPGKPPQLSDVLAVFRRDPTPRDDYGVSIPDLEATGDRQPGEDPTRSRRVDLPSGPVYLWPMRDGVCASWGNCLKIDTLIDVGGVAMGTSYAGPRGGRPALREVSGIVVDGIKEVRLTRPGADEIVIPVKDNAFHVDVSKIEPPPSRARWQDASGKEHVFQLELFPGTLPR